MLPTPEQGFSHNTGKAVDVSLYYLETGESVEMISDLMNRPSDNIASLQAGQS